MCGRYTLRTPLHLLATQFALPFEADASNDLTPRYNIAPTQQVPVIRQVGANQTDSDGTQRECVAMRWGLIPSWAKDTSIGNRMINARGETVAEKPSFRAAFKRRRCLIPADGYYEWQAGSKPKQPYHFHLEEDEPFAFAGLWEFWNPKEGDGESITSFTIITTDANRTAAEHHDPMPVILQEDDYARWLDPEFEDKHALQDLIRPLPEDIPLLADPVSTYVNKPGNEGEQCLERAKLHQPWGARVPGAKRSGAPS